MANHNIDAQVEAVVLADNCRTSSAAGYCECRLRIDLLARKQKL